MAHIVASIVEADSELFVQINQWLHSCDLVFVESMIRFFNQLGSACALFVVVPLVLLLTPTTAARRRHGLELLITITSALAIVRLIKVTVARDRPQRALRPLFESGELQSAFGETASKNSFPSGHTALVVALVILFWCWCCRAHPKWKQRTMLAMGGIVVLGAALGRIYTGMHYPLDLLGGAVVGTGCAFLGVWAGARIEAKVWGRRSGPS